MSSYISKWSKELILWRDGQPLNLEAPKGKMDKLCNGCKTGWHNVKHLGRDVLTAMALPFITVASMIETCVSAVWFALTFLAKQGTDGCYSIERNTFLSKCGSKACITEQRKRSFTSVNCDARNWLTSSSRAFVNTFSIGYRNVRHPLTNLESKPAIAI